MAEGKKVTAIITGERGDGTLTRHGLEEYVSDCVISLDQRLADQIATRRLRVVKYRGSAHGTNEYPFLIDEQGITVLPITAINLNYPALGEVVSTGIAKLDVMLGGNGYFRVAACWFPAPLGRASPPLQRILPMRHAGAVNNASISPSKNPPPKSYATCTLLVLTLVIGAQRDCSASPHSAHPVSDWRYISAKC